MVWQGLSTLAPFLAPRGSLSGGRGFPVSIKIDDSFMSLEIDGKVVATARERADGWWEVSHWPRFFDRNQAITALTVTELLESGRDSDDPVVLALREELR
jgi:hypothetical protein